MNEEKYAIRMCRSEDADSVISLSDKHKRTLGLLPRDAIRNYVNDGHVYGAFADDELIAYVLFSLPRNQIRITQLCVSKEWVGSGIARRLVDFLQERNSSRRGIILSCRRDWPSNGMWPRLEFSPLKPKIGRGHGGEELTVWWRDFNNPDLLTLAAASELSVQAVLDNNVIRDLSHLRKQSARSFPLLEPDVREKFQWCRTPGISNELNSTVQDDVERGLALDYIVNHTLLLTPEISLVEEISNEILSNIPERNRIKDESISTDVRLISEACAAGCEVFITNDEKLQEQVGELASSLGIRVLLPYQAKLFVDIELNGSEYSPSSLQMSPISIRSVAPGESIPHRRFLSTPNGERLTSLRSRVHDLASSTDGLQNDLQTIEQDKDSIAMRHVQRLNTSVIRVPLLRVASSDLENPLSRQLLYDLQQLALNQQASTVEITDPHLGPSPHVVQWLQKDGWEKSEAGWSKSVARKMSSTHEFADEKSVHKQEHLDWPVKYLGSGTTNLVMSIKSNFASQLLGHDAHLPFTDPALAMSREKVYFRGQKISRIVAGRARVLWYVSGKDGMQVVGTSQIVRQRTGDPDSIYATLGKLGTLTLDQIKAICKKDTVTAIVFRNTEIFENPISLDSMREWFTQEGRPCPPFLSPVVISEDLFSKIYRHGFGIS